MITENVWEIYVKYRPHKGSLQRSIALMVDVPGFKGLVGYLIRDFQDWGYVIKEEDVHLIPQKQPDKRIGWSKSFLVTLRNKQHKDKKNFYFGESMGADYFGIIGYCDGDFEA